VLTSRSCKITEHDQSDYDAATLPLKKETVVERAISHSTSLGRFAEVLNGADSNPSPLTEGSERHLLGSARLGSDPAGVLIGLALS
jgi:hypothetical protein